MNFRALAASLLVATTGAALLPGCPSTPAPVQLKGQVALTLIHTSDIHSRLFPYDLQINSIDAALGLGPANTVARVGGAARVSHIVQRERARADRVLHLDGGDCFQGAPVFNFFNGEAELRTLVEMGTDGMIVANHEFDKGGLNLAMQLQKWASFPVLAANYKFDDVTIPGSYALGSVIVPWTSFNLDGLRVGVVGMGNLSSLSSIFDQPNRNGITPMNTAYVTQFYVDLIRPLVDVVVFVTHLGLEVDADMIENTSGIDVVLGGHNHIALQPPKLLHDCAKVDESGKHYIEILSSEAQEKGEDPKFIRRECNPRPVVLAHSGAFAKYVGRLDLVLSNDKAELGAGYDPLNGYEVVSHNYQLFPVTEDTPEDSHVRALLEPYKAGLDAAIDLDLVVGYAPEGARRAAPAGGDSALGNMVSTAMWLRQGVQTDFAFTNTQGIRAEIVPGVVTLEEMYNVFPFDNSITKMQLSGIEVQKVMDFAARRAASRGCVSQIQTAGVRVVLNCNGCDRPDITVPCDSDGDCPNRGRCDTAAKKCQPQPCATGIYIGVSEQACVDDNDCKDANGNPLEGSCDTFNVDSTGKGRCWFPIQSTASYELATSNYLATGGSGFQVLKANTTQLDTKIQQRDALIDWIRSGKPCGYDEDANTPEGLPACTVDSDCGEVDRYACACTGAVEDGPANTCVTKAPGCTGNRGRCVLRKCREDLAAFHRRTCETGRTPEAQKSCEESLHPCEIGGETCKFVACVDERVGNFTDGRQKMTGR